MNEITERRLKHLVDTEAYAKDPLYHAQVGAFRAWLLAAEMAMRDEDVPNRTIERVLNRMVFATPTPTTTTTQVVMERSAVEELMMNQDLRRHIRIPQDLLDKAPHPYLTDLPPAKPNAPGHRDVSDLYTDKGRHGPHPT